MYSDQDLMSLYDFLRATPEGHLKKMMVSGKMSDAHLRVLLKLVRGGSQQDFIGHVQNGSWPKMKWSPAESAIKENFWAVTFDTCIALGLITKSTTKAA